ncbi:MAG: hypothetical protein AABY27_06305 [Pseudomonadota bacterium]
MQRYIILLFLIGAIVFSFWFKRYQEKHSPEQRFSKIYQTNEWGKSGPGSDPENAKPYLEILQNFFNDPRFYTIVDLGSGDWRLMEVINPKFPKLWA